MSGLALPSCRNTAHPWLIPSPSLPLPDHQSLPEIQGPCRSLHHEERALGAEAPLLQGPGLPTFFFFFRITFTPSTDTMRLTFFFLMFLALNSYCRGQKNTPELAFLCQENPGRAEEAPTGWGERGKERFPQPHMPPQTQADAHISLCTHARTGQGAFLPCSVLLLSIQRSTLQSNPAPGWG